MFNEWKTECMENNGSRCETSITLEADSTKDLTNHMECNNQIKKIKDSFMDCFRKSVANNGMYIPILQGIR